MTQCELQDIQSYYLSNDFNVLKIPNLVDFPRLKKDVTEILETSNFKNKDNRTAYQGIGLQYEDASNKLYDAVDQFMFIPERGEAKEYRKSKFITKKNEFGEKLDYVFTALNPLLPFRGRILSAGPGIKMAPHSDGNYVLNIHFPVFSNSRCLIHIDHQPYYLEPDGSLYVINARKPHYITNESSENRIHVIFTLNFFSFPSWTKEKIDEVIDDLKLYGKREKIYAHYGIT